jgi:hypothetical protein
MNKRFLSMPKPLFHKGHTLGLVLFCALFWSLPSATAAHSEQDVEPGITYWNDRFPEQPLSIHVIRVDRRRPDFRFTTTKARDSVIGLATLTDQLKLVPNELGIPKVAINGDFYKTERERYPGDPRGLLIVRGELISAPVDRDCMWFDKNGDPHMTNVVPDFKVTWPNGQTASLGLNEDPGRTRAILFTPRLGPSTATSNRIDLVLERAGAGNWLPLRVDEEYSARIREIKQGGNASLTTNIMVLCVTTETMAKADISAGSVVKLSFGTNPDLKGAETAIGGGPALVHKGKVAPIKKASDPRGASAYAERSMFEPHPRSAVGWNDKSFYFIEVDGRQKNLSMGITLADLSEYLVKIGCTEAMNLDGGGSSTIWLNGKVMNSPCFGYLRNMATSLVMVRKQ